MADQENESVDDLRSRVGPFLRQRREKLDMSQGTLAKRMGVSQAQISAWETGLRLPPFPTLLQLADVLGFDILALRDLRSQGEPVAS